MSSPPELEFRPPPKRHSVVAISIYIDSVYIYILFMEFTFYLWNVNINTVDINRNGHPECHFSGGLNSSSGGELKLYLKWKRNTLRLVTEKYVLLRLKTYSKRFTEMVVHKNKPSLRHRLTKTILFKNQ